MARTQITTQNCSTLHTPTREEFHKEWGGRITLEDFDTVSPNPARLNYQIAALRFNKNNKTGKGNFYGKF